MLGFERLHTPGLGVNRCLEGKWPVGRVKCGTCLLFFWDVGLSNLVFLYHSQLHPSETRERGAAAFKLMISVLATSCEEAADP